MDLEGSHVGRQLTLRSSYSNAAINSKKYCVISPDLVHNNNNNNNHNHNANNASINNRNSKKMSIDYKVIGRQHRVKNGSVSTNNSLPLNTNFRNSNKSHSGSKKFNLSIKKNREFNKNIMNVDQVERKETSNID